MWKAGHSRVQGWTGRRRLLTVESLESRFAPALVTWIGGVGDWADANQWSEGAVPNTADDVVIENGSIVATNISVASLTVGAGATLNGAENLAISTGAVENHGAIRADGNLVFFSTSDLWVDNVGGLLEADLIMVREAGFDEKANTVIVGGDLFAEEINLYSGRGVATVNVHEASGPIHVWAHETHVTVATGTLYIGEIELTGDPTFYNSGGDVVINSNLIFSGQNLAIVASGNVMSAPGAGAIDTSSNAGNGGNIWIMAGAQFTSDGPPAADNDTTSTISITSASATGGKIDFVTTPIGSLDASSTGTNCTGGRVTLVAFPGAGLDAGKILLPSTLTLQSGGNGSGANGFVNIIAGGSTGMVLDIGDINTTGGASSGNVSVNTASPSIIGGPVQIQNGNVTTGLFAAGEVNTGQMTIGNINTATGVSLQGGAVSIRAGATVTGGTVGVLTGILGLENGATVIGGVLNVNSPTGGPLQIISPDGGSGTLSTTGGALTLNPASGQPLTFSKTAGAGTTTLNLNGGSVTTTTTNNVTISSGVTVSSDNSITFNVNGGTFSNNGTISSASTLNISSTSTLAVSGTGTFSPGASGVNFGATNGSITFSSGMTQTVNGGRPVNINTPTINLNNSSAITADGASVFTIRDGSTGALTINAPGGGGTSTLTTTGGSFDIAPTTGGQALNFSTTPGGTILNLDGGTVTTTSSGATNINSEVILASNNTITVNVNGGTLTNNGAIQSTSNGNTIIIQSASTLNMAGTGSFVPGSSNTVKFVAPTSITLGNGISQTVLGSGMLTLDTPQVVIGGPSGGALATNGGQITLAPSGGTITFSPASGTPTLNLLGGPVTASGVNITIDTNASVTTDNAITLNMTSANTFTNSGLLSSFHGSNGGSIEITSSGNLTLAGNGAIRVGATSGSSGTILLTAPNGLLTMSSSLSVGSSPAGNASGGTVTLSSSSLTLTGIGTLVLNASGTGTGNGGTINVSSTSAGGDIVVGIGAGNLLLTATGGSLASASGNGGTVNISSGRNLTFDPLGLTAGPQGNNGNGGSINLTAGTAASGNLFAPGNLVANGVGSGNGGTINLTSNSSTPFNISSGATTNGVKGTITANGGGGSGNGGSVNVTNTGVGGINIDFGSTITVNGASGGSITLSSSSSGNITSTGGTIASTGSLTLTATNGSIGASGSPILTNVTTVAANTVGANVFISETNSVTLGASSAGTLFNFSVGDSFTTTGLSTVTAPNITLTTTGNNNITANSNLNVTGTLNLTGGGSILQTTGTLTANTVNLVAGTGAIGSSTNPILTNTNTLVLNTTGTNAFVTESNALTLGTSSVGGTLQLTAVGAVTLPGGTTVTSTDNLTINASSLSNVGTLTSSSGSVSISNSSGLTITGNDGLLSGSTGISLDGGTGPVSVTQNTITGSVSASGSSLNIQSASGGLTLSGMTTSSSGGAITIATTSSGDITSTGGTITTATGLVTLTTANGSIGASGTPILTNAGSLTFNAGGASRNVFLSETDDITVTGSNGAGGSVTLSAGGGITINGNITSSSSGTIDVTASSGAISMTSFPTISTVNGNINLTTQNSATGTMTLNGLVRTNTTGSITINSANAVTTAGLSTGSTGGSNNIIVTANSGSFTLQTNCLINAGNGNITITTNSAGSGTINLNGSLQTNTSGQITIQSANTVTTVGTITSNNAGIQTTASNAGISLGNSISGTGTNPVITLTTNGSGAITRSSGTLSASSITLASTSGSIGSSGTPILTDATNLTVNTGGGGNVFITESSGVTLNASTAGGSFQLIAGGTLTVAGHVSGGTIFLQTSAGVLQTQPSVNLSATSGELTLQNTDAVNGTIVIGQNTELTAIGPCFSGHVTLSVGPIPTSPVAGVAPANVTVNVSDGGNVFFGDISFIANPPNNTLTAKGANISISIDSSSAHGAGAITLDRGVTIFADPPPLCTVLSSLDLNQASVTNQILQLQQEGTIGGSLIVDGGGVATSGTIVLDPTDLSGAGLLALNIPAGVTVTNTGFTSANPINVTGASPLVVSGIYEFTNSSSSGIFTTSSPVNVGATGQLSSQGALTINSPTLTNTGTISSSGILTISNPSGITVTGNGGMLSGSTGIALVSTAGSLSVSQSTITGNISGSSSGNYSVTTASGTLTAGNITVTDGDLILRNDDLTNGRIIFGSGTTISATGNSATVGGRIIATLGSEPQPPVPGTAPTSGWTAASFGGGNIFYGTTSVSLGVTTGNSANVNGGVLIFNSSSANGISLGGNVTINITGIAPTISNLDLNNTTTVNTIIGLQNSGRLSGTLTSDGGAATGGDVVLQPANFQPTGLSSLNIPANITVTHDTFTASSPITLNTATITNGGILQSTGGELVFTTTGNLTLDSTGSFDPNGGGIAFTSSGGSITVSQNTVVGSGTFSLTGQTGLTLGGTINATSVNGPGGNVTLSSPAGSINSVWDINSSGVTAGNVSITAGNIISIGTINASGVGGAGSTTSNGAAGAAGGNIMISSGGNITTGYLRAYGGGGAGSGASTNLDGGTGGAGGTVSVSTTGGGVTINGDVNVSGGGGGGGYRTGGAGGSAGNITINSTGTVSIDGPILAAGGGGGGGTNNTGSCCNAGGGGGSFGGGGGGLRSGGGGGFFGGGSSDVLGGGGSGGGFFGGGAGAGGGQAGALGLGGSGATFGVGGTGGGNTGQSGSGAGGGAAGTSGTVTVTGSNVAVTGTVGSYYFGLSGANPNPFTTSPFANESLFGENVTLTATITLQTPYLFIAGSLASPIMLQQDLSAVVLTGSTGVDIFTMGGTSHTLSGVPALLTVNSGGDSDSVVYNVSSEDTDLVTSIVRTDSCYLDQRVTQAEERITRYNPTDCYATMSIFLTLGSGTDNVTIESAPQNLDLNLNTSGGDDTVEIGTEQSPLSGILGAITYDGGAGSNTLRITDGGSSTTGYEYDATGNLITITNPTGNTRTINFTNTNASEINAGGGSDTLKVLDQTYITGITFNGNTGESDTLDLSNWTTAVAVDLDAGSASPLNSGAAGSFTGIENAIGGAGNDTLLGNSADNDLTGGPGDDILNGGVGGNDRVVETGDVNFTATNNSLTGLGTDTLAGITRLSLTGGAGNNTFDCSAFSGPTMLFGGVGNDTLLGGAGDDELSGGEGDDVLDGRGGNDTFIENIAGTFVLTSGSALGSGNDTFNNTEGAILTGTSDADFIDASASSIPVIVIGNGGNDTILGSTFADSIRIRGDLGAPTVNTGGDDDAVEVAFFQLPAQNANIAINAPVGAGDRLLEIAVAWATPNIIPSNPTIHIAPTVLDFGTVRSTITLQIGDSNQKSQAPLSHVPPVSITLTVENFNQFNFDLGESDDTVQLLGALTGVTANLDGGGGDDTFVFSDGASFAGQLDGGSGINTLDYSDFTTAVTVDLFIGAVTGISGGLDGTVTNIAHVLGGAGNDSLVGDATDNFLSGGAGIDTLLGGAGDDWLRGGAGSDSLDGGTGTNGVDYSDSPIGIALKLGSGTKAGSATAGLDKDVLLRIASVIGSNFADNITGNIQRNSLSGGSGNDTISGGGIDSLVGGADTLLGGDGDDLFGKAKAAVTIFGGGGNDTINGGKLNDSIDGGDGNDSILGGGGADTLLGGEGNDFFGKAKAAITVLGGGGNDTITGSKLNDSIDGGAGDDSILGGGGLDFLGGGADNDFILAGKASVTMDGGSGNDTLLGSALADSILGGDGTDSLVGNAGADTLRGGLGVDTLLGGLGLDQLFTDGLDTTNLGGTGPDGGTVSAE